MAEDETVRQHHGLNGHEFKQVGRTGKPGTLQPIELQRIGHDLGYGVILQNAVNPLINVNCIELCPLYIEYMIGIAVGVIPLTIPSSELPREFLSFNSKTLASTELRILVPRTEILPP